MRSSEVPMRACVHVCVHVCVRACVCVCKYKSKWDENHTHTHKCARTFVSLQAMMGKKFGKRSKRMFGKAPGRSNVRNLFGMDKSEGVFVGCEQRAGEGRGGEGRSHCWL